MPKGGIICEPPKKTTVPYWIIDLNGQKFEKPFSQILGIWINEIMTSN